MPYPGGPPPVGGIGVADFIDQCAPDERFSVVVGRKIFASVGVGIFVKLLDGNGADELVITMGPTRGVFGVVDWGVHFATTALATPREISPPRELASQLLPSPSRYFRAGPPMHPSRAFA